VFCVLTYVTRAAPSHYWGSAVGSTRGREFTRRMWSRCMLPLPCVTRVQTGRGFWAGIVKLHSREARGGTSILLNSFRWPFCTDGPAQLSFFEFGCYGYAPQPAARPLSGFDLLSRGISAISSSAFLLCYVCLGSLLSDLATFDLRERNTHTRIP